jgi:hypothetical protein
MSGDERPHGPADYCVATDRKETPFALDSHHDQTLMSLTLGGETSILHLQNKSEASILLKWVRGQCKKLYEPLEICFLAFLY